MTPPPSRELNLPQIKQVLAQPPVIGEFFLPLDSCRLVGTTLTLEGNRIPPVVSGVRLQVPDPTNRSRAHEREVQSDLSGLVRSVAELRKNPPLREAVLSDEIALGRSGSIYRVRFGLKFPTDGRYRSESEAAAECQRQILRAIARAGYGPENAPPVTDFEGLARWADQVRLRKRTSFRPLILAALALATLAGLAFLFWPTATSGPDQLPTKPDAEVEFVKFKLPQRFIILLDKSGSMAPVFPVVKAEAERAFQQLLAMRQRDTFVDLIVYDQTAHSVLGGLQKLTPEVKVRLTNYLETLQEGGGTHLKSAIDLAGAEVIQQGEETELIVITDGEDASLETMLAQEAQTRSRFGTNRFKIHLTHPQLLLGSPGQATLNAPMDVMKRFALRFGGDFGQSPLPASPPAGRPNTP